MWEITLNNQLFGVLVSVVFGFLVALFYDVLKAYCIKYTPNKLFVFFKDLFFAAFCALLEFLLLMALSNGAIRAYLLISQLVGFVLFRLFLSCYWLKIVGFLLNILNKIYTFCEGVLNKTNQIIGAFENYILKKAQNLYKKALKKQKNS